MGPGFGRAGRAGASNGRLTRIKVYGSLSHSVCRFSIGSNMNMANFNRTIAAVGLLAACGVACISPASAQVARPQIGQGTSVPADLLTEVQYRGRWGGPGPGIGFGIAAGALLGAAIAGPYGPYYGYPGYYGPPGYYPPPPPPPGDPVAYCMSRFRSYDPASGSYLGFDGLRHPCP